MMFVDKIQGYFYVKNKQYYYSNKYHNKLHRRILYYIFYGPVRKVTIWRMNMLRERKKSYGTSKLFPCIPVAKLAECIGLLIRLRKDAVGSNPTGNTRK